MRFTRVNEGTRLECAGSHDKRSNRAPAKCSALLKCIVSLLSNPGIVLNKQMLQFSLHTLHTLQRTRLDRAVSQDKRSNRAPKTTSGVSTSEMYCDLTLKSRNRTSHANVAICTSHASTNTPGMRKFSRQAQQSGTKKHLKAPKSAASAVRGKR